MLHENAEATYGAWLNEFCDVLEANGSEFQRLNSCSQWLEAHDPGMFSAPESRRRRIDRLVQQRDQLGSVEAVRRLIYEVLVPPDVLPFEHLVSTLRLGAAEQIDSWRGILGDRDPTEVSSVAHSLRQAAVAVTDVLTPNGLRIFKSTCAAVRGDPAGRQRHHAALAVFAIQHLDSGLEESAEAMNRGDYAKVLGSLTSMIQRLSEISPIQ
jgi:hypothetical protein